MARSPSRNQPSGKKSHAVLVLGCGMPGVSGEENDSAPPRFGAFANDPGFVPSRKLEGFAAPRSGRVLVDIVSSSLGERDDADQLGALPYAGANRIRFYGFFSAVGTAPRACEQSIRATSAGKPKCPVSREWPGQRERP